MALVTPPDPAIEDLLNVFGLDPANVASFRLILEPSSAVTAEVRMYVTDEQTEGLTTVLRRFVWYNPDAQKEVNV